MREAVPVRSPAEPADGPPAPTTEQVIAVLREVLDPELGVNVVDLGLVYDVRVADDHAITVDMTLTSRACPLADLLKAAVLQALTGIESATAVDLNWVWRPSWGPSRITAEGREQLRALGFNV